MFPPTLFFPALAGRQTNAGCEMIINDRVAFVSDHFTGTFFAVTALNCYVLNRLCSLGESVRFIAINFSKGFDNVSPKGLLGFVMWLKSYVIDR